MRRFSPGSSLFYRLSLGLSWCRRCYCDFRKVE